MTGQQLETTLLALAECVLPRFPVLGLSLGTSGGSYGIGVWPGGGQGPGFPFLVSGNLSYMRSDGKGRLSRILSGSIRQL